MNHRNEDAMMSDAELFSSYMEGIEFDFLSLTAASFREWCYFDLLAGYDCLHKSYLVPRLAREHLKWRRSIGTAN